MNVQVVIQACLMVMHVRKVPGVLQMKILGEVLSGLPSSVAKLFETCCLVGAQI